MSWIHLPPKLHQSAAKHFQCPAAFTSIVGEALGAAFDGRPLGLLALVSVAAGERSLLAGVVLDVRGGAADFVAVHFLCGGCCHAQQLGNADKTRKEKINYFCIAQSGIRARLRRMKLKKPKKQAEFRDMIADFTAKQVAAALGCGQPTAYDWKSGRRKPVRYMWDRYADIVREFVENADVEARREVPPNPSDG